MKPFTLTLEQAREEHAALLVAVDTLQDLADKEQAVDDSWDGSPATSGIISHNRRDELKRAKYQAERFLHVCMIVPHLRAHIRYMMLDIRFGSEWWYGPNAQVGDVCQSVEQDDDQLLGGFASAHPGPLPEQVAQLLADNGYSISYTGGGMGGGHIGLPVTEQERDHIVTLIGSNFHKAMTANLMGLEIVRLRPYGFKED